MGKKLEKTNWIKVEDKLPKSTQPKQHRLLGKCKDGYAHFIYHKGKHFYWDFDMAHHYAIKQGEIVSWCEIPIQRGQF